MYGRMRDNEFFFGATCISIFARVSLYKLPSPLCYHTFDIVHVPIEINHYNGPYTTLSAKRSRSKQADERMIEFFSGFFEGEKVIFIFTLVGCLFHFDRTAGSL